NYTTEHSRSMTGCGMLRKTATVNRKAGEMTEDGKRNFVSASPGEILETLLGEAQSRGAIPGMSWDISSSSDSDGNPWNERINIELEPGIGLDQVLRNMSDQG